MARREEFGYSIPETIDAFSERYEQLRKTRPQDLTVSREDYGENFYSQGRWFQRQCGGAACQRATVNCRDSRGLPRCPMFTP